MNLSSSIPLPVKSAPRDLEPAARKRETAGRQDGSAGETGGISFPGILERSQARETGHDRGQGGADDHRAAKDRPGALGEEKNPETTQGAGSGSKNTVARNPAAAIQMTDQAGVNMAGNKALSLLGGKIQWPGSTPGTLDATAQSTAGQPSTALEIPVNSGKAAAETLLPVQLPAQADTGPGGGLKLAAMQDIQATGQTGEGGNKLAEALARPHTQAAVQTAAGGTPATGEVGPQQSQTPEPVPTTGSSAGSAAGSLVQGKAAAVSPDGPQTAPQPTATMPNGQGAVKLPQGMEMVKEEAQTAEPVPAAVKPEGDQEVAKEADTAKPVDAQTTPEIMTGGEAAAGNENQKKDQDAPADARPDAALAAQVNASRASARFVAPQVDNLSGPDSHQQAQDVRHQVMRGIADSMDTSRGLEKLTIRLNPEKLGTVDVQFLARGNQLEVVVSASGREAEQALRDGVKELSEAIADKSARFQHVDIRIENRGQETDRNDNRQDQKRDQSRRDDQGQQNPQDQQGRRQQRGSGPDWTALRQEG